MRPESCVNQFIAHVQQAYMDGYGFRDVCSVHVRAYQRTDRVFGAGSNGCDKGMMHAVALSTLGLGTIAFYEYARIHWGCDSWLPNSLNVIGFLPVMCVSNEPDGRGVLYRQGLLRIQEKDGGSLDEAHEKARRDIERHGKREELGDVDKAYQDLKRWGRK